MVKTRRDFIRTVGLTAAMPLHTRTASAAENADLAKEFSTPPASARPWVYWFWKNGNIRKDGITADLEAMARAGIGGLILMEVSLTTPKGPVEFFSSEWRELLRHAFIEAERLGLQVTVSGAPGWTGSGGPWVRPERSMQKVTATEMRITGPRRFLSMLPHPETVLGFYNDIAVLAFRLPEDPAALPNIAEKALFERGPYSSKPEVPAAFPILAQYPPLSPKQVVAKDTIVELTTRMSVTGRLAWDVPEGEWTIMRIGHTSTGQTNRPSPLEGLECDKLDKTAIDEHFKEFTAKLVADAGPRAGKTFVATHLDSWEMGSQNWSPNFRAEFRTRRGYDPLHWLPTLKGWVIESYEMTERFLWDLRRTISEMIAEYHGHRLRELAHGAGLKLSIEPYDMNPADDMTLGAAADVPMCEFWNGTFDTRFAVKEATSIAHVYGRPIVGAESFTSGAQDGWKEHPATVKALGDWAFSEGVNRMVIHRYVHQPFPNIRPGLTLAAHGLHADRTQTWWELSKPWHTYLARCQYVLQQGTTVADLLYLSPEGAPNVFQRPRPEPAGYKYDACTPEALRTLASVRNGRIVFASGAEYRALVLPQTPAMTPELLAAIRKLVDAGAIVVGELPIKAAGLTGYPQCDAEVKKLAEQFRSKLVRGPEYIPEASRPRTQPPILDAKRIGPAKRFFLEFPADARATRAELSLTGNQLFVVRLNGVEISPTRLDSLLDRRGPQALRQVLVFDWKNKLKAGANTVEILSEDAMELAGVLMMKPAQGPAIVLHTDSRWSAPEIGPLGIPPFLSPLQGDLYAPSSAVEALLATRGTPPDFQADRPIRFTHKRIRTFDIYWLSNGERRTVNANCTFRVAGKRPELWHPETGKTRELPEYNTAAGRTTIPLRFESEESYFLVFRPGAARGKAGKNFPASKPLSEIAGPWEVEFDPKWGGPAGSVSFAKLDDWTARPEEGIKYYSGTAVYKTTFTAPPNPRGSLILDLGSVREFAQVILNGVDCGVQWKRPFHFDISRELKPGQNRLEVRVTNLWPNRMIGDSRLPEDAEWSKNRLVRWPDWVLNGKPSPTGRYTFTHVKLYSKASPLLPSGLLGPVRLRVVAE